jgi:hypothetical protein
MRIRTQTLPNSFSSGNKKQEAVLAETAPRASVLAKATSRSQLTNWQWRSNRERFARLAWPPPFGGVRQLTDFREQGFWGGDGFRNGPSFGKEIPQLAIVADFAYQEVK